MPNQVIGQRQHVGAAMFRVAGFDTDRGRIGLRRLLLDEKGNPIHLLEPGQRKGIQNQHVALVAGDDAEVAAIRRIFQEFVDRRYSTARIAEGLNARKVRSPSGGRWNAAQVRDRLRIEAYNRPRPNR